MSYTPGPWFVPERTGTQYVEARIGGGWLQEVAACGPTEKPEEQRANARLIAAAPAMLEALEEMLEVHGVRWEHVRGDSSIPASWVELSDKARAAIKAAKGGA